MPRELRRGSGEILRKTKLRDIRTLSVLNKFIIGMSDCKEKNAKKPHNFAALPFFYNESSELGRTACRLFQKKMRKALDKCKKCVTVLVA